MSTPIFCDDVLADKSILVTDGGGGLGKEIGKALAAKGAKVHIWAAVRKRWRSRRPRFRAARRGRRVLTSATSARPNR